MAPALFRVIVCGGRDFDDFATLCRVLDRLLSGRLPGVVILSGGARGADRLGERYARERGLPVDRHPADWARDGKAAGPVRNERMARRADACVAFPGGRGTADMVRRARAHGLLLREVRSPGEATPPRNPGPPPSPPT